VFKKLNGFPEKLILNEDLVFSSKVILSGERVAYCSSAKVLHSHNYSLVKQFKRYFDIGTAFKQTESIFANISNEKEGTKMIRQQMRFLWKNGFYYQIPIAVIESIVKYAAYLLGKKHNYLPRNLIKILSAYQK